MQNPWIRAALVTLAFAAFIASTMLAGLDIIHFPGHDLWGRLLTRFSGASPRGAQLLLYATVHASLSGCVIPLVLAWRLNVPLAESRSVPRLLAGLVLSLGVAAVAVYRSDITWSVIQHHEYQPFLKYLFYFISLGTAVTVFGFFLAPAALAGLVKHPVRKVLLAIIGCGLVLHLTEKFEVLPLGMTPPDELVWYGLAIFGARLLAGTPAVALPAVIALLFALCHPARGEFIETPWKPMLASFLISFWALCLFLNTRSKRRFPPDAKPTPKAS